MLAVCENALLKSNCAYKEQHRVHWAEQSQNYLELTHLSDKLGQMCTRLLLSAWVLAVNYGRGNLHTIPGVKERMLTYDLSLKEPSNVLNDIRWQPEEVLTQCMSWGIAHAAIVVVCYAVQKQQPGAYEL